MKRLAFASVVGVLALSAASGCSSDGAVATVEGAAIAPDALEQLHPAGSEVDADERASSLLLLILHRLLVRSAEDEFGFSVTREAQQEAFAARTDRFGSDVDGALKARGMTRDRVLLEADLDVVRAELEERLVRAGVPGLDVDAAYRTFLSVNSHVCLSALRVSDSSIVAAVEELVDEGADVDGVEDAYPDGVERLEVECASPAQLAPGLASVALDGEVGDVHVARSGPGLFVAAVDQRDAPPVDAVRDEVLQIAAETQGPKLFNAWAADILRAADVDVADSIGRWAPAEGTNGIPTVLAN